MAFKEPSAPEQRDQKSVLKEQLSNLRDPHYAVINKRDLAQWITDAVEDERITWDELGTNDEEINKLLRANDIESTKNKLVSAFDQTRGFQLKVKRDDLLAVIEMVKSGKVTWTELVFQPDLDAQKLEQWVLLGLDKLNTEINKGKVWDGE